MKKIDKVIFAFLLLAPCLEAVANCSKAVDPKKVILFIDVNHSNMEIDTAQKSACLRGETLVIVPRDYKEQGRGLLKRNDFPELIEKELTQMRQQGAKLKNVTISGHDGGGLFGGLKGSFSRQELSKVMDKFEDVNEVQSLHLLGCYTGVKNEVINWSMLFPDLRLIGGYDGSAPASDKPAGHEYLKNLLEKEKKIISESDDKKIISNLKLNLKSLNMLNAGLYIKPLCQKDKKEEDEEGYLYETLGGVKLSKMNNPAGCMQKSADLKMLARSVDLYNSGEKEPPVNSASGELRTLYNEMRKNEHCPNLGVSPKVVFGLLFHEGMKKSFGAYFKKEMDEVELMINQFSEDDRKKMIDDSIKSLKNLDKQIEQYERIADLAEKDPELLKKEQQKEKDTLISEYNELLKKPEIKKFAETLKLSELTNTSEIPMRMDFFGIANLSQDDLKFISKYYQLSGVINPLLSDLKNGKTKEISKNFAMYATSNKQMRQYYVVDESKIIKSEELKKLWIPNEKNLKNKSRKEIMLNAHYLNEILSNKAIPQKMLMKLASLNTNIQKHLVLLDNPFSWHEYTGGSVEAPPLMGMGFL